MGVPKKKYVAVTVILALTACLMYWHISTEGSPPEELKLSEFPLNIGEWRGTDMPYPDWLPESLGANEFIIRNYATPEGQDVVMYVAYFDARYGGTVHNPDVCYPAQGWAIVERSHDTLPLEAGNAEFTKMLVKKGTTSELVFFYFQMGNRIMPELAHYRLTAIAQGVLLGKIGGALIRFSAPIGHDVDETYRAQIAFMKSAAPLLKNYLPM